jgi:formylglycine-generating enzyme required for sulfatase activity/dienelactone hydrolase
MSAATSAAAAVGTLLAGKYLLLEVLGRGGMGIVYKAEDTRLHRPVALKFLPGDHGGTPSARERFLMEARAAAALSHPHICTIYEIHDEGETPFIVMECIDGQSLRARIQEQPLPAAEAVQLATQISEALAEAHEKGVIHRDIKSANIMVTDKGQAKVMDFGLAKVRGETLHTREGITLGTAAYMSPEQARGDAVDQRTDLWSLGVVLYEMLSGKLPFPGDRNASILYAVVHEVPKPLKDVQPGIPAELERVVSRALKRDLAKRYQSAAEMVDDLKRYQECVQAEELGALTPRAFLRGMRRPRILIPIAACVFALAAAGAWFVHRQSKIRWAREQALPEIARTLNDSQPGFSNFSKAYALVKAAQRYIPHNPDLVRLIEASSVEVNVTTTPPGARVYAKEYSAPEDQWQYLGVSPIRRIRLARGFFSWKIHKEGFEPIQAAALTGFVTGPGYTIQRTLDPQGTIPARMVRVSGAETPDGSVGDFFIDKYEVTNKQYKQFVDAGGYHNRKYWTQKFLKGNQVLTWETAMAELVDQTGRPGPSTWQAGEYPNGQDDYPVSGVSWYEAAAYAEYAGKTLPTRRHWETAAGLGNLARPAVARLSNFKGEGSAHVGSYRGMSAFGAFDMAGNVREWCWNATPEGRLVRGGAWNDAIYMFGDVSQAPPFDRSPRNGFRCTVYIDPAKVSAKLLVPFEPTTTDFYKQAPVSHAVFQVYADQFSYDQKALNPRLESRGQNADWVQERVVVDAVYGDEKLPMHLFLPRRASSPYQTVIFFPSALSVTLRPLSKDLEHWIEFEQALAFLVKNGRAVVYPIYKGTFERREESLAAVPTVTPGNALFMGAPTRQYTEFLIQIVKDFRRTLDYLETRPEIDSKKLAYLGSSWGSEVAPVILAVENRIKTGVLVVGGVQRTRSRPEADAINYITRVKMPVLLLNGRYDLIYPYETIAKPLFDLLGTPAKDKVQRVYDADHFVPHNDLIKETLSWLDRYLGPVK